LLAGKEGIFGLCHGTAEGIQDAGVHLLFTDFAEALVETVGIGSGKLGDGLNAELIEILEHRFADSAEVAEAAPGRVNRSSGDGGGSGHGRRAPFAQLIEQIFAPLLVALAEETHQVTTGMEAKRTRSAGELHAGLVGRPVAFAIVAGMAAGNKVLPCRFAGA